MVQKGQLNWVFANGEGYESLIVTNLNEKSAHLTFDIYFSDRDPIKGLTLTLSAERVSCLRLDKPFCDQGYNIPRGCYSLVLHSDIPVVAMLDGQGYTY